MIFVIFAFCDFGVNFEIHGSDFKGFRFLQGFGLKVHGLGFRFPALAFGI